MCVHHLPYITRPSHPHPHPPRRTFPCRYEKLCRWDEALEAYERRLGRERAGSVEYQGALLGKMRCLASLAEWETLSSLCRVEWGRSESHMR